MNAIVLLTVTLNLTIPPGTPEKPSAVFPLKIGETPTAVFYDAAGLSVGAERKSWDELKVEPKDGATFVYRTKSADGEVVNLRCTLDENAARYEMPSFAELKEGRLESSLRVTPQQKGTVKVTCTCRGPRSPILRQFKQADVPLGETGEIALSGEVNDLGWMHMSIKDTDGRDVFNTVEWGYRRKDLNFAIRVLHTDRAKQTMYVRSDNWFGCDTNHVLRVEMLDFDSGRKNWETTVPAIPTPADAVNNGQGVAEQPVDVRSLPPGEYKCVVTLRAPDGKRVADDYFFYAKPDGNAVWEGTTFGSEDTVPSPWTQPVWREDGFSCWNREVKFGGRGLVASIVSAGREILSAPVALEFDGRQLEFRSRCVRRNTADAVYEIAAVGAPVTARVRAEFDGVMWFDVTYAAPVRSLAVSVPVRRDEVVGFDDGASAMHKLVFEQGKRQTHEYDPTYNPWWWMGDTIGLMGGVDCWRGYRVKDLKRLYRLAVADASAKMTMTVVDTPLATDERRTFSFYLQATPTKPKNRDLAALPPSKIRSWTGHFGQFFEERCPKRLDLARNASFEEDKRKGMRVFYYNAAAGVSTVFPWWGWYGQDWTFNPDCERYTEEIPFKTEWERRHAPWTCACLDEPSFFDYKLYDVCNYLWNKDLNIKDMYFDLTEPRVCWSQRHGCSFKDEFGHLRFKYGTQAIHELLKRVYRELKKKNADAAMLGHILRVRSPAENFFDALTMGEGYDKYICYSLSYYDVLNPETMRINYASRSPEFTIRMLPQMSRAIEMYKGDLKKYDPYEPKHDRANRHAAAYFKIHDLCIVGSSVGNQWTRPDEVLQLLGRDRTHRAYYNADCPVKVAAPEARFLYALYAGNGKRLLILLNDTDAEVTKTVSVAGLTGLGADIFSKIGYDFCDGTCRFTLPPRESRFILFNDK